MQAEAIKAATETCRSEVRLPSISQSKTVVALESTNALSLSKELPMLSDNRRQEKEKRKKGNLFVVCSLKLNSGCVRRSSRQQRV